MGSDLHLENFGTWRDIEGRLVWGGVNDFDEGVQDALYTMDLVRLVTSAHAAAAEEHLAIRPRAASEAILEGYRDAMREGGRPFVLAENHRWLRKIASEPAARRHPCSGKNWKYCRNRKFDAAAREVESHLRKLLPDHSLQYEKKRRVAGLGSLGHTRVVLIGRWHGCYVAREAKELMPRPVCGRAA